MELFGDLNEDGLTSIKKNVSMDFPKRNPLNYVGRLTICISNCFLSLSLKLSLAFKCERKSFPKRNVIDSCSVLVIITVDYECSSNVL